MSETRYSAHWLASQPLKAKRTAIQALNPDQLLKLRHEWSWWARDEQKPPPGGWRVWLYLAGRGAGKNRPAPGAGVPEITTSAARLPLQAVLSWFSMQ